MNQSMDKLLIYSSIAQGEGQPMRTVNCAFKKVKLVFITSVITVRINDHVNYIYSC